MAWAIAPNPADYDAVGTCQHRDCAETWRFYETPCPLCGVAFVYGDMWSMTDDDRPGHVLCIWKAVDDGA